MLNAKRVTVIKTDNDLKIKEIKPIKIINKHERNKRLIMYELLSRKGSVAKLKEDGKIVK